MTNRTIYLVDDEPMLLDMLSEVISLCGISSKSFTQANQLFETVKSFNIDDIIILDIHMPQMDGVEVMNQLTSYSVRPSLILISGHDSGMLQTADQLGKFSGLKILATLQKPISIERFKAFLKTL